jgi:hypothetical protein
MKIRLPSQEPRTGPIAWHRTLPIKSTSFPLPTSPASRLSLDPALGRQGAVDGGWWPHSRNAIVELPVLISSLNNRIGAVLRLGVDARDWDDIPRRLTVSGHLVRIGRFADLNHKIIVTLGSRDHIFLLVIPPQTPMAAAKSALAMAATGKNSGRPEEILAASGVENEITTPRTSPDADDPPHDPELRSTSGGDLKPVVIEDVLGDERGAIGRRLDDSAPSPRPCRAKHAQVEVRPRDTNASRYGFVSRS